MERGKEGRSLVHKAKDGGEWSRRIIWIIGFFWTLGMLAIILYIPFSQGIDVQATRLYGDDVSERSINPTRSMMLV